MRDGAHQRRVGRYTNAFGVRVLKKRLSQSAQWEWVGNVSSLAYAGTGGEPAAEPPNNPRDFGNEASALLQVVEVIAIHT